jgi:hypothetical protein
MELYQPSNINIIGNDLPPILELKYNIYYVRENFLIEPTSNINIIGNDLPPIIELNYNHFPEIIEKDTIFSGIVKNTSNISLNPREPKYCSLQILDYKTLLSEGKTLDFVISNKTIKEAIEMVIDAVSGYGFEKGDINILNPNEIIGTYSTENKTAYDVFQYLADISGAKWNCRRKNDTTMYIDFNDPSLMPKGKDIEYTQEWFIDNNLVDLKFNYNTGDYRNKQVILSDAVIGDIDYTERLSSDGMNKDFVLGNNIASITKVEIDGVIQSVATKEEKEIGIYADFYYEANTNILSSNKTLPYGAVVDITYLPIIRGREVVQNDNEIERISNQLDIDGVISRYESRNDETDSNKLLAIGSTYLRYKGEAEITLTIKTHNKDIYNVGQMVYFNAPIEELRKNYMVKSKDINMVVNNGVPGDDLFDVLYTYTLSSSFNSEKAINWFDNKRNKLAGNIAEGEYISRNIDIRESTNIIWNNLRVEELTDIVGDNVLNSVLNTPFNK